MLSRTCLPRSSLSTRQRSSAESRPGSSRKANIQQPSAKYALCNREAAFWGSAPFFVRSYTIRIASAADKDILASARLKGDKHFNIPSHVEEKVGKQLHKRNNHPLCTIKTLIHDYFNTTYATAHGGQKLDLFEDISPIVNHQQCFDSLLIPKDHPSRSPNDTYYITDSLLLRSQTSAHQTELLRQSSAFLLTGDVYRRDTIDTSHFPVFHQMEGLRVFSDKEMEVAQAKTAEEQSKVVTTDMKRALEGMVHKVFGNVEMRWVDAYFPFTEPSYELEIFFKGEWLEVLGCGQTRQEILSKGGRGNNKAWAFGLGLERLAMVLFDIPDIRLFWSDDARFLSQFTSGRITKFKPYSKMPTCYKDISFWVPTGYHEHSFYDLVRKETGDIVEDVKLVSKFVHPKTSRESHLYRLNYRSMDRTLTNEEVDKIQQVVRQNAADQLGVELR